MHKRKIGFAAGSRADYGIDRNYLKLLNADETIDLSILVTGALLSREFGHQVELIYKDGFHVDVEIEIDINPASNSGITHSIAIAMDEFGRYFEKNTYDLLIILGDRYEMLSVAAAAAMNRIPILHLHGGEATYGNYDEFIRHSITKMSLFHFTSTEEYRRRVIQLGENPSRVFHAGALGAENCLTIDEAFVPDEVKALKGQQYFVLLFHPETLTDASTLDQINEVLKAIEGKSDYKCCFIGSNADTHSDIIRKRISDFVQSHENCLYFENLPTSGYHYLVTNSLGLVGNSSSGLIEAPSLNVFTINIGDRQAGRVRGNSVIDVPCEAGRIGAAMDEAVSRLGEKPVNPYYRPSTAVNYYKYTLEVLERLKNGENKEPKRFFDFSCGRDTGQMPPPFD